MPALALRYGQNNALQFSEQIVQNHIHLSKTIGSAPENAPDLKWLVRFQDGRYDVPVTLMNPARAVRGQLRVFNIQRDGQPLQLNDFRYVLKVRAQDGYTTEERVAQLKALHAQTVYLVDHFHVGDNLDHTDNIRRMFCEVGPFDSEHLALQFFWVPIRLTDHTL